MNFCCSRSYLNLTCPYLEQSLCKKRFSYIGCKNSGYRDFLKISILEKKALLQYIKSIACFFDILIKER